jgi:hypothetical protein
MFFFVAPSPSLYFFNAAASQLLFIFCGWYLFICHRNYLAVWFSKRRNFGFPSQSFIFEFSLLNHSILFSYSLLL